MSHKEHKEKEKEKEKHAVTLTHEEHESLLKRLEEQEALKDRLMRSAAS